MGNPPVVDRETEEKEVLDELDQEQEVDQMEQALEDAQDRELSDESSDDEVLEKDEGHEERMLALREEHRRLTEKRDRLVKLWPKLKEVLGDVLSQSNEDPAEREHPRKGMNPEFDAFLEASKPGFQALVKEVMEERRVRLAKEEDGKQGSSSDVM